jgi:putative ABC transport system permease protein
MSFRLRYIFREMNLISMISFRFVLAILIGVGTIVGINSYKNNISQTIGLESRNLLGGDLQIESSTKLTEEHWDFAKSKLPAESQKKLMVSFASMLGNEIGTESSLSTVKALEKGYPFFGNILTEPSAAYKNLRKDEILLDEGLAKNIKVKIGEKVRLGNSLLKLAGYIRKEPGNVGSFMAMAPSSIVLDSTLKKTGLEQRGSRIRYYYLIKLPEGINSKETKETLFKELIEKDLVLYHHTEIGSGTQKFIQSTYDYMSLLGLSAFFLGAISILLSTRSRLDNKTTEIAVLKCLGAKSKFYSLVFLSEIFILSFIGSIFGLFLGYYFQFYIPDLTGSDFLAKVQPRLDLKSIVWGISVGILIPQILALESIYKISKLSPLVAIRKTHVETVHFHWKAYSGPALQWTLTYLLFTLLAYWETKSVPKSLVLAGTLILLPMLVFLLYLGLRNLARILQEKGTFSGNFNLVLGKISRRGSGLSLPIVGIGSAIAIFILTMVMRESLLSLSGWNLKEERANMFILDLQKEQVSYLKELQEKYDTKVTHIAPVVGARLLKINGKPIEKRQTESDSLRRDWRSTARTREYFLSYRDEIYPSEKVTKGKFWTKENISQISVEHDFAKSLGVKVGDSLSFNVQGIEIEGKITNTRYVNWSDMKPNFVVLFNPLALQKAPGYFLSSFFINDAKQRYAFQKEIVQKFPNTVVIDIEKTIQGIGEIIDKISSIINLMTIFVFISSLLLLFSSLSLKHKERTTEISLFKIVGANSKFIRKNYIYEALLIGSFSFLSALILGLVANVLISEYVLNLKYDLPIGNLFWIYLIVNLTILILYLVSIQNSISTKPKEFLRSNS